MVIEDFLEKDNPGSLEILKMPPIRLDGAKCIIDADNIDYRTLNYTVRKIIKEINVSRDSEKFNKIDRIELNNVLGQRYIGDGIQGEISISINGTPGNDLAAFMDGPGIEIFGNVQDGTGNTMNSGKVVVHGSAGDILGYSMRGGEIYVMGDVGYRSGIHMKSYLEKFPVIVIGGKAGHFLGEYMAGGIIIVLGLDIRPGKQKNFYLFDDDEIVGDYVGTGMHGGQIFIRGEVNNQKLGKEIIKSKISKEDEEDIKKYINNYFSYFGNDSKEKLNVSDFIKLTPFSRRPYGKLYAY
jgi:glutamate synthase domain-containing protein 3